MKIAAIIPSRYHSSRFEGKPLALIKGKPMIEWVYRQVEKSCKFNDIIVATDDQRIADAVNAFGGTAAFTSPHHRSGSERLWEVMEKKHFDAAINIQGDEPIIPGQLISALYDQLETGQYDVVTPVYHNTSYDEYLSPHVVKAVIDAQHYALYFSRSPLPHCTKEFFTGFYQHIGLYGYLKDSLQRFIHLPPAKLETLEKLEQLRFLENGIRIKVIMSRYKSVGVDVPGDIARVERILDNFPD
jgi:3-deoxy-manno-octulosonate cytidylyltransferase (CMP-KDO synthetase)